MRVTVDFTRSTCRTSGCRFPSCSTCAGADCSTRSPGVWPVSANLTETDEPERVETALVDANYFSMLGVGAQLGRVFGASDAEPGITEVAVISDALWQRRFGGDPNVLGRRIRIDNDMYSIIGVAPDVVSPSRPRHRDRRRSLGAGRLARVAVSGAADPPRLRAAGRDRPSEGRTDAARSRSNASTRSSAELRTQYPATIRPAPAGRCGSSRCTTIWSATCVRRC